MQDGSRERLLVHSYSLHISYRRDCQNVEFRECEEVKLAAWIEGYDKLAKNPVSSTMPDLKEPEHARCMATV